MQHMSGHAHPIRDFSWKPAAAVRKGIRFIFRPVSILALIVVTLAGLHLLSLANNAATLPTNNGDCASVLRTTDYTRYIQKYPDMEIGAIQFVNQLVGGQPAVLVPVQGTHGSHLLDIYIYGCAPTGQVQTPILLFKRQGLPEGSVAVSAASTLLLSYTDTTLSKQALEQLEAWQQDIYQEYRWQNGMFIQTIFPGLYPVITRHEAELLQHRWDNGDMLPWHDPLITAQQMARDLLHWSDIDFSSTLVDLSATTAHIVLRHQHPLLTLQVTLQRLIQQDSDGLWFVTSAQTPGITLDRPLLQDPQSSPLTLSGTSPTHTTVFSVSLFDHTLTEFSTLAPPQFTLASRRYTGTVLYMNSVSNQPGLLLLEQSPANNHGEGQLVLQGMLLG